MRELSVKVSFLMAAAVAVGCSTHSSGHNSFEGKTAPVGAQADSQEEEVKLKDGQKDTAVGAKANANPLVGVWQIPCLKPEVVGGNFSLIAGSRRMGDAQPGSRELSTLADI